MTNSQADVINWAMGEILKTPAATPLSGYSGNAASAGAQPADRNAIIEECARACEALRPDWPSLGSDIYEVVEDCATAIRALKESAAPQDGGKQNARPGPEPAVAAPKLSEARRLENAIVAAKLDAFEAADLLGAIIASLGARYGEDAKALDDVRHYSKRLGDAIMELDK